MEKLRSVLDYAVGDFTVGKILSAVLAFVVCYVLQRLFCKLLERLLRKFTLDATLKKIIRFTVKLVLWFITAMVVIEALGVSVTSMLAAFSVVGLAASLAVQDSLANLASGIMLLVSKPFKLGDYVEIDGVSGTVVIITLIHTKLKTLENKTVYVPNSKVIDANIVNFTEQDKRLLDLSVAVSYDAPIDAVRQSLLASVQAVGLFSDTPDKPFAAVQAFDDSSISYVLRAWVKTPDYWPARYRLLEQIKTDFDARGIEMTYPHMHIHIAEASALPKGGPEA